MPSALPLLADAGIPMIVLTLPMMVILLIPVIVTEGFLCKKWLGLSMWQAMKSNAISNLVSTIFGLPMAWAIMLGVELAAFSIVDTGSEIQKWNSPTAQVLWLLLASAWIGPPSAKTAWLIPAAILVLLVPFFLVSYIIEYLVIRFMVGVPDGGPARLTYPKVQVAVRNANLITYGVMFLATTVWMIFAYLHPRGKIN